MTGRTILVDDEGEVPNKMEVSCGVLQSSVIGYCLWNIFYDNDLLQLEFQGEVRLVGFVDDIALVKSHSPKIQTY